MIDVQPTTLSISNEPAERYVIGCMLRDQESLDDARRRVAAGDFSHYPWHLCYGAICEMRDQGRHADPAALLVWLRERGRDKDLGPTPELTISDLAAAVTHSANLPSMAATLKDASRRRQAVMICAEAIRDLEDKVEPAADTIQRFEPRLAELLFDPTETDAVPIGAAVRAGLDQLEERANRQGGFVKSGYADIDDLVPSFEPGELVIVGARTGIGKSAFALGLSLNMAAVDRHPVYFASLEMSRAELGQRFAAMLAGVNVHALRNVRTYSAGDMERARRLAIPDSADVPLFIDDNFMRTVRQIGNAARKCGRRHGGVKAIIVDYLQQVQPEMKVPSRQQQVGQVTRGLKMLARELKCPVIALAQLNRGAEDRADSKPRLADLREAGDIEQDADSVFLLYRDPKQDAKNDVQTVGCIVAKQRSGPVGEVTLAFRKSFTRFENMARSW